MSNILIEKIVSKINWEGEPRQRLSKVNDVYNKLVKKGTVSVEEFLESIILKDSFVLTILLLRKREEVDSVVIEKYRDRILDMCQMSMENNKYKGGVKENNFNNLSVALVVSLLYEQENLTEKIIRYVYECIDNKYDIFSFFQLVFRYVYSIDEMRKSFVLLLNVMYKILDTDVNEQILRKFEIQMEIDEDYKDAICKLIARALRQRQIGYITVLLRIFREIPLNDLKINKHMLVKLIKKNQIDEFLEAILLLKRVYVGSEKKYEDGMSKWWKIINKKIACKNIMWPHYEGYLQIYYISKLIQHNPTKIDVYLCLIPQTSQYTILKEESSKIIQETTELLFGYEAQYLKKYLEFLGENNVYNYNEDDIVEPSYIERNYYFIEECIEKYITKGASIKELVNAYMNTYLRVAYSLFSFCNILVAYFDSMIHANAADLSEVFGEYIINSTLVKHQGRIRFKFLNINIANQLIGYSYLNQEIVDFISSGKENLNVHCFLDKYILESREICISFGPQKEGIKSLVKGFLQVCNRISEKGYLEESDKRKLSYYSIPETELDKGQRVDISLCILDTCLELSIHSKNTLEFLDILQTVYGKKDPFLFLGYNDLECRYHKMFEENEQQKILNIWEKLKKQDLSVNEAMNIYIHTVLRFFVPLSCISFFFAKDSERYTLNDILGKYLFTGIVAKINNHKVSYIEQMDFLMYEGERIVCDREVLIRKNIKRYTHCTFHVAFYDKMYLYVYAVKEKKQNATKKNNDSYKEILYKILTAKTPDIVYFNQLKFADVSFEYTDKLEIENIQIDILERYATDITIINRFLMANLYNNFCVYSKENLKKMGVIVQNINSLKAINVMRKILLNNNEEILLKIYFNTSLKYYADLNCLLRLVSEIGNMELLIKYMEQYPLWISISKYGLDAINFMGYEMELVIEKKEEAMKETDEKQYRKTEMIKEVFFEAEEIKCRLLEYKLDANVIVLGQIKEDTESEFDKINSL